MLDPFISQHPQVKPRLTVTNRNEVLARLRSNEDDFLVMGQVPQEFEVQAYPFINNELVALAPPNHPLADKRSLTLEQLSKERFLVREQGSGNRQAVDRLFAEHGIQVSILILETGRKTAHVLLVTTWVPSCFVSNTKSRMILRARTGLSR